MSTIYRVQTLYKLQCHLEAISHSCDTLWLGQWRIYWWHIHRWRVYRLD